MIINFFFFFDFSIFFLLFYPYFYPFFFSTTKDNSLFSYLFVFILFVLLFHFLFSLHTPISKQLLAMKSGAEQYPLCLLLLLLVVSFFPHFRHSTAFFTCSWQSHQTAAQMNRRKKKNGKQFMWFMHVLHWTVSTYKF